MRPTLRPSTSKTHGAVAGLEVALLVEDAVVGQLLLEVDLLDAPAAQQRGGVVARAALAVRIAHDDGHVEAVGGELHAAPRCTGRRSRRAATGPRPDSRRAPSRARRRACAPAARAASTARRMRSALPAKSPTVVLIWATAIFMWNHSVSGPLLSVARRPRPVRILDSLEAVDPARMGRARAAAIPRSRTPSSTACTRAAAPRARPAGRRSYLTALGGRAPRGRRAALREGAFVRRVRLRLGVGRRVRAPRPRLLPEAALRGAVHARHRARGCSRRTTACARGSRSALLETARATRRSPRCTCSSPPTRTRAALRAAGLLERSGVQFHWRNAGYASFEDFLARALARQAQEDPPGAPHAWPTRA